MEPKIKNPNLVNPTECEPGFAFPRIFKESFYYKSSDLVNVRQGLAKCASQATRLRIFYPKTLELHPLRLACFYYQVSWKPRHWLSCNFNLHKHFCHTRVSFLSFPLPPDFLQECRPILILFLSNQLLFFLLLLFSPKKSSIISSVSFITHFFVRYKAHVHAKPERVWAS